MLEYGQYRVRVCKEAREWHGFHLQPNHVSGYTKYQRFVSSGRVKNNMTLVYIQDRSDIFGEWESVWLPMTHGFVIDAMCLRNIENVGNVILTKKWSVPGLRKSDGQEKLRTKSIVILK